MNKEILDQIVKIVCTHFEITEAKIRMQRSFKRYVFPRQILFYILKRQFNFTFCEIGREFNLDHSTIMHSVKRITNFITVNDELTVDALKSILPLISGFEKDAENVFIILELPKDAVNHFGGVDNMINSIKSYVNLQCESTNSTT